MSVPPPFITVPSSLSRRGLPDAPDLVEVYACWDFLRPASREGAEFWLLWPQPSRGKWAAVSVQGTLRGVGSEHPNATLHPQLLPGALW